MLLLHQILTDLEMISINIVFKSSSSGSFDLTHYKGNIYVNEVV